MPGKSDVFKAHFLNSSNGAPQIFSGQVATGPGPIAVQEPKSRPDTWTSVVGQGWSGQGKSAKKMEHMWLIYCS